MIKSVGYPNFYSQRPVAFSAQPQTVTAEKKKEGMSTTTKTMLGLGALAAVGIGGLLLKKHIDLKNITKEAEQLLKKPEDFSIQSFRDVLKDLGITSEKEFNEAGKVVLLKKSELVSGTWKGKYNALHKAMNLSDNGFAIALRKPNNKFSFRYFDPKNISCEYIKNAIKDEGTFVNLPWMKEIIC